jgi:serine protease AprX
MLAIPQTDDGGGVVLLDSTWEDASVAIAESDIADTYTEAVIEEIKSSETLDSSQTLLDASSAKLETAALGDATIEQTVTAQYDTTFGTVTVAVEETVVLAADDQRLLDALANANAAVADAEQLLVQPGLATDAQIAQANAAVDAAVAAVDAEVEASLGSAAVDEIVGLETAADAVDEAVAALTNVQNDGVGLVTELNGWAPNLRFAIDRRGPKRHLTGNGVDIALIDSGIAPVQGLNGANKVINGVDLSGEGTFVDGFGHGTHLAGLIAGNDGTPSGTAPFFTGIAPDARLVNIRVANSLGETSADQVIAGIEWAILNKNANGMNIRVIALALGYDEINYMADPLSAAVEAAWMNGIAVVVAGGNDGNASNGLEAPAIDPYIISVAASNTATPVDWLDDTVATFSNAGNGVRNPDITVPGKSLVSLRAPGSWADQNYPQSVIADRFAVASGTSQATAVAAGSIALLLEKDPTLTPDQIKNLLQDSGRNLAPGQTLDGHGALRLNVALNRLRRGLEGPATQQSHPQAVAPQGFGTVNGGWLGGSWNGGSWSGGSWNGGSWNGGSWSGGSWSGGSWSGGSWSGGSWSGGSWSGGSWSGGSWSGGSWN